MDFLKNFDWSPMRILKMSGIAFAGILLLAFAFQIVATTFKSVAGTFGFDPFNTQSYGYDYDYGYGGGYAADMTYEPSYPGQYGEYQDELQLSTRNVAGIYPAPSQSPMGDDAEAYEVTNYSATIETRKLESTCKAFEQLKLRADVIFENASSYDTGCDYTFKVKHESVEEVLAWLRDLDPKTLSENTYTIKRQIDDYTNEVEVLESKRASIDATLKNALAAYDEISRLATNTQNADALAKIIDSKIGIIERLTEVRININEQLDRLSRAKAEQLDRLDYTYFSVNVYENRYIDWEYMGDSWKQAIKDFFYQLNKFVQDVTLNLLLILFLVIQWAIYALIALFVVKYGWKVAKYIWFR